MPLASHTQFAAPPAATEALLAAVAALPQPGARPADGGWSGVQVVRHLIGAETGITALLAKQAAKPAAELPAAGLKSWFRSRLMSWMLARPNRRFKAPARLSEPVPADVAVTELRAQWATVRAQLERVLTEFPVAHGARAVFEHPRAGWLNVPQTLRFMTDHVRHHQQQVRRLAAPR
ncbi:MAG: DinB family protein [Hymenobacteraceae bacterium]|nr:DinB family protein [Hymenobacteraceae bacterium]